MKAIRHLRWQLACVAEARAGLTLCARLQRARKKHGAGAPRLPVRPAVAVAWPVRVSALRPGRAGWLQLWWRRHRGWVELGATGLAIGVLGAVVEFLATIIL